MASNDAFEGLDVTADEVQRIEKALKNEEFRKLFVEYAQEISDPENRKKYEEELAELERSRGMDVKFLHPKPGYVLKTSINGEKKAFINICKNESIAKPEAVRSSQGSKAGVQWSLPYSLAPGRDDYDHAGKKCMVYDCMFHPDCFEMINKDNRFRTLMDGSAMDGIEREFKVKFDRNNVKKPKMKFKGRPQATVLRTPNKSGPTGDNSLDALKLSYPYDQSNSKKQKTPNQQAKTASKISGNRDSSKKVNDEKKLEQNDGFTEPKYSLIHRGHFDMQHCTFARDSMPSTRPQELILKVELPLLKTAASVQLDVFEKRIFLECKKPVSYRLDLSLPYPVDEDKGSAKFDKSRSCLIITLAVLPPVISEIPSAMPASQEATPLVEEIVMNGDSLENNALRTNENDLIPNSANNDENITADLEKSEAKCNQKEDLDKEKVNEGVFEREKANPTAAGPESTTDESGDAQSKPKDGSALESAATESDQSYPLSNGMSGTTDIFPNFDIYQSDQNVTLIIRETKIEKESVKVDVMDEGKKLEAVFKRTKVAPNSAEERFSLLVSCKDGQSLDESMSIDVSEVNVVLVIRKKEGSGCQWSLLKAGVSADALEERHFVTVETVEDILKEAVRDERKNKTTGPCTVTHFSDECMKAEFQVTSEVANSEEGPIKNAKHKAGSPGAKKSPSKPKVKESIIPALDLGPAAEGNKEESDSSSPRSDSQSSSPTGSSIPSSLKSALRSPRRRACKSVSFSEEVLVELFLDGPGQKKTQKGGNNRKKGGRRTPFFGPRRIIEKLKDNSWEYFSDSELLHRNGGGSTEEEEDHEVPEWNLKQPDQILMRQSSSESESGQEIPSSPRSKSKSKSKGSRRRRKEKARREASLAAVNGVVSSATCEDYVKPGDNSAPLTNSTQSQEIKTDSSALNGGDADLPEDFKNNNDRKTSNENEGLSLEMMDHKTKCAFEFSNQVIYDLDD